MNNLLKNFSYLNQSDLVVIIINGKFHHTQLYKKKLTFYLYFLLFYLGFVKFFFKIKQQLLIQHFNLNEGGETNLKII